jgi:TonB-linked SusC/RagA family outer membrane protein
MKMTAFLLLIACLHITAAGLSQGVTLSMKNAPLGKVFIEISRQTGVSIICNESLLANTTPVTISVQGVPLQQALDLCIKGQPLTYSIRENNVIVKATPARSFPHLLPVPALPVDTTVYVTGLVTDSAGGPMPGVTVLVKGTQQGTQTNAGGRYTIRTAPGSTLVFSFTGYVSKEIPVGSRTSLDISLAADVKILESFVVVGYGTRKRQNLTGAVSSVTSDVIKSRPVANALSALQGEIPGVVIQRGSGKPGTEDFDLNVRGRSSTNGGNSPLVLIDGIPGDLNLLNPDDIQSIDVLKDAAASIYGARAAGGVFIVTTKKGLKGRPRINYSTNLAITKLSGMMKSPSNYEMAVMDNEANIHNGAAPMYTPDMLQKILNNDPNPVPHPLYDGWMLFFTNTNWIGEVMENGFQQKHNINISGGGENSSYYLSGSYTDQRGVIKYAPDDNKRYNLRLNYDYDFSKRFRLETKVAFENQNRTDVGGVGGWLITEAVFGMPNHPVYSRDGKFFAQGGWGNAVAEAKEAATATYKTRNLNTNFKLIAEPIDGLKLNLQAGINHSSQNDKDIARSVPLYNWEGNLAYYAIANPNETAVDQWNAENTYRNYTAYAQYSKSIGRHDIEIMAGASHEENDYDYFGARRMNFVVQGPWSLNLGSTTNMTNEGGGYEWGISSLFSRISYSYDNKYLLEANLRYDGSSRFQPDRRWGLFPGVSVAWRLSREAFLKDVSWMNDLKLRASYGQTGNQEGIGYYDYLKLIQLGRPYDPYNYPYPFGAGLQSQAASLAGIVSTDRTWETLINRNIGLDATLLGSRLNFSFDYFIKTNRNLLIPVTYPSVLGAVAPFSNSGELKTTGFEASLGWKDKIGSVEYNVRLQLSDAQNKVMQYGGADTYTPGLNFIREGYPVNTYFAYVFDGVIRTQEELSAYKQLGGVPGDIGIGDARFKDVNGDGKISPVGDKAGDDGDVINAGTTTPRYIFGANLGVKFSNFDISVFLQGVGKRTLFREGEYAIPWSDWWRQPPQFYYQQTWNEDRPEAYYPRLTHGSIRYWNYQPSTLQQINGAYVRLKNLQVGYSLPQQLLNRVSISQARIYFSGQDLAELHHVKGGWDPEAAANGFNYPFQRFYSFGIDVTF